MTCVKLTKEKSRNLSQESTNQELIRSGIIAELDAINLYQSQIENTDNRESKDIFEHVRDEEKEHVAELLCDLMKKDSEQEKYIRNILKSENIKEINCTRHSTNR